MSTIRDNIMHALDTGGCRFRDIPKLINARYTVNAPILHIGEMLADYKEYYGLDLLPDFQRGHVWNESQKVAFMEYLFRGGRFRTDIKFNMPGWPDNPQGNMVIVDGLQRITAITDFMANKVPIFGNTRTEWSARDTSFGAVLTSLHAVSFSVNGLQTRAEVLQWYLELNEYGTPHSSSELARVRELLTTETSK